MKSIGLNRRQRKMANIPSRFPMGIAKEYKDRMIKQIVLPMETKVMNAWENRLSRLIQQLDSFKADSPEKIQKILEQLRKESQVSEAKIRDLASDTIDKTKKFSIKQVDEQIKAIAGVKPHLRHPAMKNAIQATIHENVRLIKSIPTKYLDEVERVINEGVASGMSKSKIKQGLLKAGAKSSNKARLIARDQVGNVLSRVSQARQTQAGVKHYTWMSVGDSRVRPSHQNYHGQKFSWKEGSPEGHPGEPIQCRCIAVPSEKEVMENFGAKGTPVTPMPTTGSEKVQNPEGIENYQDAQAYFGDQYDIDFKLNTNDFTYSKKDIKRISKEFDDLFSKNPKIAKKLNSIGDRFSIQTRNWNARYQKELNDLREKWFEGKSIREYYKQKGVTGSKLDEIVKRNKAKLRKTVDDMMPKKPKIDRFINPGMSDLTGKYETAYNTIGVRHDILNGSWNSAFEWNNYQYTIRHEFMHAIDDTHEFYKNKKIRELYNNFTELSAKEQYHSNLGTYAASNPKEFVAEVYARKKAGFSNKYIDETYEIMKEVVE